MANLGTMTMKESGEMYLETILRLSESMPVVRSIDVVHAMGLSKPSVSRAVNNLQKNGYIEIDRGSGALTLLEPGRVIAEKIYERHKLISAFLVRIGVPYDTAQRDACRIEHIISDETFKALKKETERLLSC